MLLIIWKAVRKSKTPSVLSLVEGPIPWSQVASIQWSAPEAEKHIKKTSGQDRDGFPEHFPELIIIDVDLKSK